MATLGWFERHDVWAREGFHMTNDPDELCDLSQNPEYAKDLKRCHDKMCALFNPAEANDLAFADQAQLIEQLGGVETIINSEEFDHTPIHTG